MIDNSTLPHILAVINSATIAVLCASYWLIRSGAKAGHRKGMLIAAGLGGAFLAVYLVYHFNAGLAKFGGQGVIRPIYFTLLIVHVVMAAAVAIVVPMTLIRGLMGHTAGHRRIARWAFPAWMFVSVSGVVVYVMAVHLYPYHGVLALQ
jgi:putative membrane protein